MSSFRECCTAKSHLQANDRSPTLCTAAMRPLVALSAFLDVSSLNLAVSQGTAIFCSTHRPAARIGRSAAETRKSAERTGNRATAAAMRRMADELDELARLRALGARQGKAPDRRDCTPATCESGGRDFSSEKFHPESGAWLRRIQ